MVLFGVGFELTASFEDFYLHKSCDYEDGLKTLIRECAQNEKNQKKTKTIEQSKKIILNEIEIETRKKKQLSLRRSF